MSVEIPAPSSQQAVARPTELQKLNQSHLAMVELALAGMTRTQIAEALERSSEGVGLIMQSPLFQQEFARRRKQQTRSNDTATASVLAQAKQILENNAVKAANRAVEGLDSLDESVRLKSADNLLDRVFGGKTVAAATNQFNGPTMVLQGESLANLVQALAEDSRRAPSRSAHNPGREMVEALPSSPVLGSSQSGVPAPGVGEASQAGGSGEGVRPSDRGEAA